MQTEIRLAHSKRRHGFTVFTFEAIHSAKYGLQRAGWHMSSGETLEEAKGAALAKIRHDWEGLGLQVPPIKDCGRVADAIGRASAF